MPALKEIITIRGRLASADFAEWIIHRARRLGLRGGILKTSDDRIDILIAGPVELIDAMEIGCSLGPISVQVEHIDRAPTDLTIVGNSFAYISDDSEKICTRLRHS